jgi:acetyl-CoA carboxylase biotin carboxyl carrier protein
MDMDGNGQYPYEMETSSDGEHDAADSISVEQLQRLVRLLDGSDVSEIEVKHEGTRRMRLVLRKARAPESSEQTVMIASPEINTARTVQETKHPITAPLVGIFHSWARPKGGALVAVGDHVKAGQLVGTIQSLNVLNEVETAVAGRVIEIFVQDGQPVEYGQPLMIVDSSEEA